MYQKLIFILIQIFLITSFFETPEKENSFKRTIAFYNVDQLEEQLKLSTKSFLEDETQINAQQKKAHVSKLFLWFLNDFGGKKGIREIISSYLDQDLSNYKLVYKPYSWDEHLDNYAQNRF